MKIKQFLVTSVFTTFTTQANLVSGLKFSMSAAFGARISKDKLILEIGSNIMKTDLKKSETVSIANTNITLENDQSRYGLYQMIRLDITKEYKNTFIGITFASGNKIEHHFFLNNVLKQKYQNNAQLIKESFKWPAINWIFEQNTQGAKLDAEKNFEQNMNKTLQASNIGDFIIKESFFTFFGPHFGMIISPKVKATIALGTTMRAITAAVPLMLESMDIFSSRFCAIGNLSYKINEIISTSLQIQYEAPNLHTVLKIPFLYGQQFNNGHRVNVALALIAHIN